MVSLAGLNKSFKSVRSNLSKQVKSKFQAIKDKKALIDSMTIGELEKVYKNYVSKSLKVEVVDMNTRKTKMVSISPRQLKVSLMRNVSVENIISSTPRLNNKAKEVKKAITKVKKSK